MEIAIIILAVLLTLAGLAGCIIPVLPGAPLNFAAILILFFLNNEKAEISAAALVI